MKPTLNIRASIATCVLVSIVGLALSVSAGKAHADDLWADVLGGYSEGPPYPSEPAVLVKMYDKATPILRDTLPIEEVSFNFADGIEDVPMRMVAYDTGGGVGQPGATAILELYLQASAPQPPQTLAFDCYLKIDSPHGVSEITSHPAQSQETDFDADFEVALLNGIATGNRVHGVLGPGQPLGYGEITWGCVPAEGYDMLLHVDMEPTGSLDSASPILTLEMTGTWVPEPATLALVCVGGLALIRRRR